MMSEIQRSAAKECLEFFGLTPPYSEEELQAVVDTNNRILASLPDFRDVQGVVARVNEYGSTGGENFVLAMEAVVEQLKASRKESK